MPTVHTSSVSSSSSSENETKYPFWISTVSGLAAGSFAALVGFPGEGVKKKLQSGVKLSVRDFYPRNLYTGGGTFIAFLGPVTGLQSATKGLLNTLFPTLNESHSGGVVRDTIAGGTGALISTVVECTVLTQQHLQRKVLSHGPLDAMRLLYAQKGIFGPFTGFPALAKREGVFTACYSNLPIVQAAVKEQYGPTVSYFVPPIMGVGGAVATQPFDTAATRQQNALLKGRKITELQAYKEIIAEHGVKGLWAGSLGRIYLFAACMYLISKTQSPIESKLTTQYDKYIRRDEKSGDNKGSGNDTAQLAAANTAETPAADQQPPKTRASK